MKKVIGGIALILSLAGLGYSGFTIYGAAKGALEKKSLNKQITELKDKKVKTEASLKDVTEKNNKLKNFAALKRTSQVRGELDVRGMNADEAISEIETYFDRAMLTGYNEVYIIHGKGTMVLRKKIQEYLRTSKYVSEFKDANQNEGGVGCTVVTLK